MTNGVPDTKLLARPHGSARGKPPEGVRGPGAIIALFGVCALFFIGLLAGLNVLLGQMLG
jgi:hypothetical protein